MASTMSFPLTAGTEVLGLNGDEGRPVFEYVDGKRTDNQRRDALGSPVFRHKALIRYTADAAEEVALVIDSAAPLGVLKPVKLDPATATLTVRPEDAYNLALTVTGCGARRSCARRATRWRATTDVSTTCGTPLPRSLSRRALTSRRSRSTWGTPMCRLRRGTMSTTRDHALIWRRWRC